jgi:methylated-DNA-protein-cysteine methyltransferase-like protein
MKPPTIHPRRKRIYDVVKRIPRGRVATYGQIAALAGLRGHARQVGYALHALPERSGVPWHRVVNAQGKVSLAAETDGALIQRRLLEKEGVRFSRLGVIDLDRYRWRPRACFAKICTFIPSEDRHASHARSSVSLYFSFRSFNRYSPRTSASRRADAPINLPTRRSRSARCGYACARVVPATAGVHGTTAPTTTSSIASAMGQAR